MDKEFNDAVNQVVKEKPSARFSVEQLVRETSKKFIENKIDAFPAYCAEARRVNALKDKILKEEGNAQGWTDNYHFKLEYEIPRDLYLFMSNLVYKDFWCEENKRVWRAFMSDVMAGVEPMDLLVKTKMIYGSNESLQKTGEI